MTDPIITEPPLEEVLGPQAVAGVPAPAKAVKKTSTPLLDIKPVAGPITQRGLIVLGMGLTLLVLALLWRYPTLLGIAVALLLAVVCDLLLVLGHTPVEVRRTVEPTVVERHADCYARVEVSGKAPALARATVVDTVGEQRIHVPLDGGEVRYRVPTLRRGLLPVGPLESNRIGPFGLAMSRRPSGHVDYVRVLPRAIPVREIARGRRRSAVGADESMEYGGTDLVGLHEYVPGDDLRRLHWATSARTGILMVRDDAEPSTPHLTVVLDDRADHYGDHSAGDTHFEDAVEIAAALCRAALAHNHPVHLATLSGSIDVRVSERIGAAEADAQRLYEALAEVDVVDRDDADRPKVGDGQIHEAHEMRLPQRGLDAVAVISGNRASLAGLTSIAARGASAALLVVDPDRPSATSASGAVTVLTGHHSHDLAKLWDRTMA